MRSKLSLVLVAGVCALMRSGVFADVYLVETNPNAASPYATWATAATSLSDALGQLTDGSTLWVSNGTFALSSGFTLKNGTKILSMNGPDKTIFVASKALGSAMNVKDADSTLAGVTIKDVKYSGNIWDGLSLSAGGTVSNCLFQSCGHGNYPGTLSQTGGLLVDCTFRDSMGGGGGTCGAAVSISGGVMERCRVFNSGGSNGSMGGAVYVSGSGVVRHTLVTGSVTASCSGMRVDGSGLVSNCTVVANQAKSTTGYAGIYVGSASARVKNTICVGNYDYNGTIRPIAGVSGFENCLVDCFTTEGTDPRFAAPLDEDFTLLPDTPCPNTGAYPLALPTGVAATLFREELGDWNFDPQTNAFRAVITPDGATCDPATCYWTFDGTVPSAENHDAVGLTVTNVFGLGAATVRFRATVNDTPVSADKTDWFTVKNGYVYVVKDNPNAAAPYDTWATAAAAYDVGVKALQEHMVAVISNGNFICNINGFEPPRFSTIRSANGPDTVSFTRKNGDIARIFNLTKYGARIEGFTFNGCYGTGGGPLAMSVYGTIENCVIKNCTGGNNWPTLMSFSAGRFINCTVKDSSGADTASSGNAVILNASGETLIDRCVFSGNTRTIRSGVTLAGVVKVSGGATVRNSLFVNNTLPVYTAIYVGANGHAENCTVVKNQARVNKTDDASVSAVYAADATASIVNCLVAGNVDLSGSVVANTAYASGCEDCFTTCREADTITDTDIKFTDPNAGDYSLQAKSVCVNAGTELAWMAGAQDLAGNARIAKGIPDIGAYEYTPSTEIGATLNHAAIDGRLFAPQKTEFSAEITPEGAEVDPTKCYWTFDGRTPTAQDHDAVGLVVTNIVGIGSVSVSFRATVNGQPVAVDETNWYEVKGEFVYVSKDSANPVAPYNTWATAAKTFMDAFPELKENMTMVISNGTYYGRAGAIVEPPKNTTIRSANGPTATTFGLVAGNFGRVFNLTQTGCTIADLGFSSTHTDGGPLTMSGDYCVITNCIINVTKTVSVPWQNLVNATAGTIVDCLFTNSHACTSSSYGPQGICVTASGANTLVDRCVFADCSGGNPSATTYAMGIVKVSDGATVRNSLFKDNTNPFCTIYVGANGRAENCTLVRNAAQRAASSDATVGAVYAADATAAIVNVLTVQNTDSALQSANTSAASGAEGCFTTCRAAESVADADIKFVDPAVADYTLQAKSVCVNAGTERSWMDGALDLAKNPRVAKDIPDIGAYEYTPSTAVGATLSRTVVDGRQFAPQRTEFSAEITPEGAEVDPETCYWTFDGSEPSASHYDAVGLCVTNLMPIGNVTVKFRATVNGQPVSVDQVDWYRAKGEFVYVMSQSENPVAPYDTWATAAKKFMDAVPCIEEGMTAIISNGTYYGNAGAPVELPQHATVRSLNGPEATKFGLAANNYGIVFRLSQTGSRVLGLGFSSTHTDGGPIVMSGANTVVSNCVVNNNAGYMTAPWGRLLVASAGTVVDCVFTNNQSGAVSQNRGVGIAVDASGTGTLIDRCVFADNFGGCDLTQALVRVTGGATIRNSLFKNNRAPTATILVGADGHAENCTLVENTASRSNAVDAAVGAVYAANPAASIVNVLTVANKDRADEIANTSAVPGAEGCFTTCYASGDPLFKDAAKGDYHLRPISPCVNTGTLRDWMADAQDLDGASRVIQKPDIGCYERARNGAVFILR